MNPVSFLHTAPDGTVTSVYNRTQLAAVLAPVIGVELADVLRPEFKHLSFELPDGKHTLEAI